LDHDKNHKIILTEFFVVYRDYPEYTAGLLYYDFPIKFTWIPKIKSWTPRKDRFDTIGRVYFYTPISDEYYYLRILLYIIIYPLSFEYLRIYEDRLYDIFQEVYLMRGLLESDDEWDIYLNEAGLI
jgi:hypothetical protein